MKIWTKKLNEIKTKPLFPHIALLIRLICFVIIVVQLLCHVLYALLRYNLPIKLEVISSL